MRTTFPPTVKDEPVPVATPTFTERYHPAPAQNGYALAEVAALPTERIEMMSRSELIEVIRSIRGGHLRPGVRERLPLMDAETLRKLVFLTRRYCRNQQLLGEDDLAAGIVAACG
jgi:hypothetical protein